MPDRVQDLTNHRKVAVACKNYTDKEIKASEERILSIVARNNVDFIDHTNEPTYRFTAPLNSKLLMLQSIAGNSNKITPSTPSDDSVARLKTIPDNTYKSQIDYIGGKSVKYNQLVKEINNTNWNTNNATATYSDGVATFTATAQNGYLYQYDRISCLANHKYLVVGQIKLTTVTTDVKISYLGGYRVSTTATTSWQTLTGITTTDSSYTSILSIQDTRASDWDDIQVKGVELINLTEKFGAGNEPSDVATAISLLKANGYKLDGTDTYSTGKLKHAIVSGVKYDGNLFYDNASDYTKPVDYYVYPITLEQGTYTISAILKGTAMTGILVGITPYGDRYNQFNLISCIRTTGVTNTETFTVDSSWTSPKLCIYASNTAQIEQIFSNYGIMLVKGTTAPSTYIPYVAPITKPIPSEVLADNRYGLGFDNTNYNHLDSDGHLRGKYNTRTYALSDVLEPQLTYENVKYYSIPQPTDYKYYNEWASSSSFLPSKFDIYTTGTPADSANNIGRIVWNMARQSFYIGFALGTTLAQAQAQIDGLEIVYEMANTFDQDYSQYFTPNWNKVDLDNQYATCEMVVAEPIDMPNKVEYYGTIIHSLATAVKQDGFNVWDEEWEVGAINENGQNVPSASYIRSKNYISVSPDITYYSKTPNYNVVIFYFDINKNIISYVGSKQNTTFTTPSNCYYVRFHINMNYFSNDICINISNQDLNGTYKPYKAPITRLLPNSEAKYSWGITNGVRNTRVFCDDECNPVNEGSLAVGNQDLGGDNWTYSGGTFRSSDISSPDDASNVCLIYTSLNYPSMLTTDKSIYVGTNIIQIHDESYTNATAFKTAMNGEILWYQKNATDTETLDDFDFSFDCEEGDTFTIIGCELLQCYATYSFLIKEAKSNE